MKSFQHSGIRVRPAALKMAGKPGTLKQWEDRGLSELALILSGQPAHPRLFNGLASYS